MSAALRFVPRSVVKRPSAGGAKRSCGADAPSDGDAPARTVSPSLAPLPLTPGFAPSFSPPSAPFDALLEPAGAAAAAACSSSTAPTPPSSSLSLSSACFGDAPVQSSSPAVALCGSPPGSPVDTVDMGAGVVPPSPAVAASCASAVPPVTSSLHASPSDDANRRCGGASATAAVSSRCVNADVNATSTGTFEVVTTTGGDAAAAVLATGAVRGHSPHVSPLPSSTSRVPVADRPVCDSTAPVAGVAPLPASAATAPHSSVSPPLLPVPTPAASEECLHASKRPRVNSFDMFSESPTPKASDPATACGSDGGDGKENALREPAIGGLAAPLMAGSSAHAGAAGAGAGAAAMASPGVEAGGSGAGIGVGVAGVAAAEGGARVDGWDDPDGYYQVRVGEVINGRYRVVEMCGRGMFSVVLRAVDLDHPSQRVVAVKMVRANDMMSRVADKVSARACVSGLCVFVCFRVRAYVRACVCACLCMPVCRLVCVGCGGDDEGSAVLSWNRRC